MTYYAAIEGSLYKFTKPKYTKYLKRCIKECKRSGFADYTPTSDEATFVDRVAAISDSWRLDDWKYELYDIAGKSA